MRSGNGGTLEAIKVIQHDTASAAIMNGVVVHDGKDFVLAGGEDGDCQMYRIKYQLLNQPHTRSKSDGYKTSWKVDIRCVCVVFNVLKQLYLCI